MTADCAILRWCWCELSSGLTRTQRTWVGTSQVGSWPAAEKRPSSGQTSRLHSLSHCTQEAALMAQGDYGFVGQAFAGLRIGPQSRRSMLKSLNNKTLQILHTMILTREDCKIKGRSGREWRHACIQSHLPGSPLQYWAGGLLCILSDHHPERRARCLPDAACISHWAPQSQTHSPPADMLANFTLSATRVRLPHMLACRHDRSAISRL